MAALKPIWTSSKLVLLRYDKAVKPEITHVIWIAFNICLSSTSLVNPAWSNAINGDASEYIYGPILENWLSLT